MAGEIPDVSTLTKVWYSETKTGEKTQVSFTEEIPELESVSYTHLTLPTNREV